MKRQLFLPPSHVPFSPQPLAPKDTAASPFTSNTDRGRHREGGSGPDVLQDGGDTSPALLLRAEVSNVTLHAGHKRQTRPGFAIRRSSQTTRAR